VPAGSPATGSRRIRTRVTSTSSSAQPVTGSDPAMPLSPSPGVSNEPNGATDGFDTTARATLMVLLAFDAPVYVRVTVPVWLAASDPTYCVEIVRVAGPLPEAGVTTSHGADETAVQVTAPGPFCASRAIWPEVCAAKAAPETTAPKRSDVVSSAIIGGAGACVMTNGCPAMVSVTCRAAQVGLGTIE
jgi:hypothetical protein